MKTVKCVSDLTGVSVRMLHHYDKIGLLTPAKISDSGYRLYDQKNLMELQQILFFKELDFSLEDIKSIIKSPVFDRKKALSKQKELLILKKDRINNLIKLIDKTLKGENNMSFEEFKMVLSKIKNFTNFLYLHVLGEPLLHPNINEFMPGALESLKELQSYGVKLVLWTCRNNKFLTDAVEFLSKNGIVCEKYNENSSLLKFETSNKIYGDYYLDDRSFPGFPGWNTFMNEFRKAYNIK